MKTFHICVSIDSLLKYNNEKLGLTFQMDGKEVREELIHRKRKGELFIPSEHCKNFDPKEGCNCNK